MAIPAANEIAASGAIASPGKRSKTSPVSQVVGALLALLLGPTVAGPGSTAEGIRERQIQRLQDRLLHRGTAAGFRPSEAAGSHPDLFPLRPAGKKGRLKLALPVLALVLVPATLMVSGLQTSPDLATFANGVMIRFLDYNDGYTSTGESGHPSDSIAAVLTGLCYAELGARFPEASGCVTYVRNGFGSDRLARLVGGAMTLAVAVAAASIARGTAHYLGELVPLPQPTGVVLPRQQCFM